MSLRPLTITATLDGLSFGTGPDTDGYSLVINKWDGWYDSPPAAPQISNRVDADGAYRGPNPRGAKYQLLTCTGHSVSVITRELLIDKLAALLPDRNAVYPLVRNDRTRTLFMYVERDGKTSITVSPDGHHLFFTIPLVSRDANKYTTNNAGQVTTPAAAAGDGVLWLGTPGNTGVEWNGPASPYPGWVYQTQPGASGAIVLTNSGTQWAPIVFTVTGTVTAPNIVNLATGQRIVYPGTVVPGGSGLVINTGTGRAELDGQNVTAALSPNQMFQVPPKSSITVVYSATSSSGSTLSGVNANVYL
jgi:hypothetical protein